MVAFTVLVLALAVSVTAKPPMNNVLHESRQEIPTGWISTGIASPVAYINIRIALHNRDFAGLENMLYHVSTPGSDGYGQHITSDQVKGYMAPSDESVSLVQEWLLAHGIVSKGLIGHGDWLGFSTTVGKASELFGAKFLNVKHLATGKEEVRTLSYSIPENLRSHIELAYPMISFSNPHTGKLSISAPAPTRSLGSRAIPSSCSNDLVQTPSCVKALYGLPSGLATASQNSIKVTGYSNDYAQASDLKSFLSKYRPDVPSSTTFKLETIDGGSDPQGIFDASFEANIDMQWTIGLAPGVPTSFLSVGNSSDPLDRFLDTVNYISASDSVTHVLTTTHNSNENSISLALATKICNAYASLGTKGISVIFSSGDGGVSGDMPGICTTFVPTFPASCPYLTSVGATSGVPETVASFSGGGFSNYFPTPSYQAKQVGEYIAALDSSYTGLFNASGRGYPDVAAYGLGYVVVGGVTLPAGGTSMSSPVFGAVVGLLNDALITVGKPPLGFLNPWLYSTAASAFNDITNGSNWGCLTSSGFSATSGWDPVTGFGTPNFAKLKAAAGL